jgi:hypothetical protein
MQSTFKQTDRCDVMVCVCCGKIERVLIPRYGQFVFEALISCTIYIMVVAARLGFLFCLVLVLATRQSYYVSLRDYHWRTDGS